MHLPGISYQDQNDYSYHSQFKQSTIPIVLVQRTRQTSAEGTA